MKLLKVVALGVAGAMLLSACSDPETPTGGEDVSGQTISVSLSEGTYTNELEAMLPQFEEETGVNVELNVLGLDQLSNQYQVRLNAASADLDVMLYRPLQEVRLFQDNGWLMDLTELVEQDEEWNWEDFTESSRASVTVDDGVYGVPVMTEREILFYNKEMFDEAGIEVPTTMEEVRAAAEALHDPDNNRFGIVLRGSLAAAVTTFSGFLYSHGGDWYDEDGNATIASPEAVAAYEYYGGLLRDFGPLGADSVDAAQARAIFQNGQAAMYIDPDSGAGLLEDPAESQVAGKIGYAPFPTGPEGMHPYDVTSWAGGISEFSEHKEASWQFLQWATSSEVLDNAMKNQKSPSPRSSSWDNEEVAAGFSEELVGIFQSYVGEAVGYDRPVVVEVSQVRDIVGRPIVAAINGEDVEEAANQANEEFQAYLESER